MLVLSRKPGQRILIGPNIEIVISEVRGNQVRIGIDCPRQIRVLREELQLDLRRTAADPANSESSSSWHPEFA